MARSAADGAPTGLRAVATGRWGGGAAPAACALVAACVSLPGLRVPFLSDDWANLAGALAGARGGTPLGDYRPIFLLSLALDLRLGGLSAPFFHLTQTALAAVAAALVPIVVGRVTGDRGLGLGSGLLFAIHPYHVETAAWISARTDLLMAVFFLSGLLAYDRWRERLLGLPILALALYEAALLSKESALSLPLVVAGVGCVRGRGLPSRREWARGVAPFVALTAAHLGLRTWALGGPGRTLLGGSSASLVHDALGLAVAAVAPFDTETIVRWPWWCGGAAALLLGILAALGRRASRAGRAPGGARAVALGAAVFFALLAAPDVVGFQRRYLFLPLAASSVLLCALVRGAGRRTAAIASALLAASWLWAGAERWSAWREAGRAGETLIGDLSRLADRPEVREIVVANAPFRVRGASVGGRFESALAILGRRAVPVRALAWFEDPAWDAAALDGAPDAAIRRDGEDVVVRLRVDERPYSRLVAPTVAPGSAPGPEGVVATPDGTLRFLAGGALLATIPLRRDAGRAIAVWDSGRLLIVASP